MNRRWRHEAARQHDTLQAVCAFTQALPPLAAPLGIADVADLYATYSLLHAKNRHPQVRCAPGFYYFLADAVQSPAQAAAAAEEAARQRRQAALDATALRAAATAAQGDANAAAPGGGGAAATAAAADPAASGGPPLPPAHPPAAAHHRYEAVVVLGSKHPGLTMDLLQRLFLLEGPAHPPTPHMMLAIVDDDGSVSLSRAFGYVQPPFEGPETLPPISAEQAADDSE